MTASLDLATQLILGPAGLQETDLERVLHQLLSHEVDNADLYFQTSRHESWSLEDGIVKGGTHSLNGFVVERFVAE